MLTQPELLSRTAFSILLALSLKPRHGYELMQQIEHDTDGRIKLGPGGLYGTIKELRDKFLIEEMPGGNGERRRYYRLTKRGYDRLGAEMRYYETAIRLARERHVFSGQTEGIVWAS